MNEQQYPIVTCAKCGKKEKAQYVDEMKNKMVSRNLCFSCLFWTEILEDKDNPRRIFVEGHAYFLGKEKRDSYREFRGYGGSRFFIGYMNGGKTESTNLWHNGDIPELFKNDLPNTAIFLSPEAFQIWPEREDQKPDLQQFKDNLTITLYKMTRLEALNKGICIQCHKEALPKCYSEAGRKEYRISGLCEKCFDDITS